MYIKWDMNVYKWYKGRTVANVIFLLFRQFWRLSEDKKWLPSFLWLRIFFGTTPGFLPGEFHGKRSLVCPWDHKESDMTESLLLIHTSFLAIFTKSAITSSTEFLNPSKSSMRVKINFQTSLNVDVWTSLWNRVRCLLRIRLWLKGMLWLICSSN